MEKITQVIKGSSSCIYKHIGLFCFFGYENFRNLIFGPSFRQPARKASSGEIYLKNKDLYI